MRLNKSSFALFQQQMVHRMVHSPALGSLLLVLALGGVATAWQPRATPAPSRTGTQPTTSTQRDDIRLPSFQDVTPSQTSVMEVKKLLGEPAQQSVEGEETILTYDIQPFSKVDIIAKAGTVTSIVVHLDKPSPVDEISRQLEISDLVSAPIPEQSGNLLGRVYPERGILFGFAEGKTTHVAQIILEPIQAEPFILRAEYDTKNRLQQNISDLQYAAQLEPRNPHIQWLLAERFLKTGKLELAQKHIDAAESVNSRSAAYRLTRAKILARTHRHQDAIAATESALRIANAPEHFRARAECQLGDLLASGPKPDFKAAMEKHLLAIRLAVPLANEDRFVVRRAAKRVLLDAHLGAARNVALGSWRRKKEVVPKWLETAEVIANELIENESGDLTLRLKVQRQALTLLAHVTSLGSPKVIAERALKDAESLLADGADPLFAIYVRRVVSEAMLSASIIEHNRKLPVEASEWANRALSFLDASKKDAGSSDKPDYLAGRVYFMLGAIHATHHGNHTEAVSWYEKSRQHLERATVPALDRAIHGDRFVAMGVSYWFVDSREKALDLTKQGTELVKKAVEDGVAPKKALGTAYGNLASMHRQMGNTTEADRLATLSSQFKAADEAPSRR